MGKYNFDQMIERKNTNSLKFDYNKKFGMPEDCLPLWVADMDFETAPGIRQALQKRTEHGIFGYSLPKEDYFKAVTDWMRRRHGWDTKAEWYLLTPGVVFALGLAVRAFTKPGDAVLIQRPVYYPFTSIIEDNERVLINNPLIYKLEENGSGHYQMDVDLFEQQIVEHRVKMFILCNPHNPVGRVWTGDELEQIGDICLKHQVIVISDEIHEDFIYKGHKHAVFANLKKEYADITVTCTSPSKTFNLAGLQLANLICSNAVYRRALRREVHKTGYDEPNTFGIIACQAAYQTGEDWMEELKDYLAENILFVKEFLKARLPKIRLIEPEGTYLIWLDFREYGKTEEEWEELIVKKAKLWLDAGSMFGSEGIGFQRINIATPRVNLEKALIALENVIK